MDLSAVGARLTLLATCDHDTQVFGARSHRYKLEPPLSRSEIEALESELGVALPEEYRAFLLELGRSGAGPYYGLVEPSPLIDPRFVVEGAPFPDASAPFPFEVESPFGASLPEGSQRYDGCLLLAQHGCGYASLLVVSGPSRGEVWSDFSEGQGALVPEAPSFLAWYRGWIEAAFFEWASKALPDLARETVTNQAVREGVELARATVVRIAATEDPRARRTHGYLHLYDGRFDEALLEFEAAREVERDEPEAKLAQDRIAVHEKRGDHEAVVREARAGLASPGVWASTRAFLLDAELRAQKALGLTEDVLATLERRAADSRSLEEHHELVRALLAAGDRAAAAQALARAARRGVGADRGASSDAKLQAVCEPIFDELAGAGDLAGVRALVDLMRTGPN